MSIYQIILLLLFFNLVQKALINLLTAKGVNRNELIGNWSLTEESFYYHKKG